MSLDCKGSQLTGELSESMESISSHAWASDMASAARAITGTSSGLPWYQDGKGILGATLRNKDAVDLLLRKRILETEGVARVIKLNTLFSIGSREYSVYMQALLISGRLIEDTLTISLEGGDGV